jgi:hypothetical protein
MGFTFRERGGIGHDRPFARNTAAAQDDGVVGVARSYSEGADKFPQPIDPYRLGDSRRMGRPTSGRHSGVVAGRAMR